MDHLFAELGITIPEVYLPAPSVDLYPWAVVACDQYTSQPEYWESVAAEIDELPSTYHLIFPEVYLEKEDQAQRAAAIHQTMAEYLRDGIVASQGTGFVYVERRTGEQAKPRRGLLMAIDLECYDYRPGSKALVRASEGTVLERIPPRVKIREGAPMELPHIMLLMDDPEHQVIAPLAERAASLPRLYQTELMMGGGRVAGYQISDPALVQGIYNGIRGLADRDRFIQKYGLSGEAPLLFAVGDGNHSLATAKAVWERMKQNPSVPADHPARYALVEVVNIHDPALQFEPIHRVLFGVNLEEMFAAMRSFYEGQGMRLIVLDCNPGETANAQVMPGSHRFKFVSAERSGWITVGGVRQNLEVGTLQSFIDDYLASHAGTTVDYIHGDDVTAELAGQPGNVGFLVPVMEKSQLFKTVIVDGVLPRKTFSMGEANEKRYYLECRKIE